MKRSTRIVVSLLILAAGMGAAAVMIALRPTAARTETGPEIPLVEVLEVAPQKAPAIVRATGVVTAAQEVDIVPQVSGRIVEQSPRLRPGGRFKKGELLARIDPRDYQVAIREEESRVRQAELDLQLEAGRQTIAEHEWELLGEGRSSDKWPLALRKPQMATAEQRLNAARGGLERARLNLERTNLRAPFDAMVLEERIDIGQVVGPGGSVVSLIGTGRFRVSVSVPMERLAMVEIPGVNADRGSRAKVAQEMGSSRDIVVEGRVLGLGAELDPQTRTAQLLITIDHPLEQTGEGLPLLPGAFVRVEIAGRLLEGAFMIPRTAVFDGNRVWVARTDDRLASRRLEIGWRSDDSFFVTGGLEAGARVVTTPLALPVEGMAVRVQVSDVEGEAHGGPRAQ